jgi:hypothetical protein
VEYEEIANISSIEATAVIFYELGCSEQMLRELTVKFGDRGGSNKPLEWKYIAPETNGARLFKMLCN